MKFASSALFATTCLQALSLVHGARFSARSMPRRSGAPTLSKRDDAVFDLQDSAYYVNITLSGEQYQVQIDTGRCASSSPFCGTELIWDASMQLGSVGCRHREKRERHGHTGNDKLRRRLRHRYITRPLFEYAEKLTASHRPNHDSGHDMGWIRFYSRRPSVQCVPFSLARDDICSI